MNNFLGQPFGSVSAPDLPPDPPWWWISSEVRILNIEPQGVTSGRMAMGLDGVRIHIDYEIFDRFFITFCDWVDEVIVTGEGREGVITESQVTERLLYALNSDYDTHLERVRDRLAEIGMLVMPDRQVDIREQDPLRYLGVRFAPDGTPLLVLSRLMPTSQEILVEAEFSGKTQLLKALRVLAMGHLPIAQADASTVLKRLHEKYFQFAFLAANAGS